MTIKKTSGSFLLMFIACTTAIHASAPEKKQQKTASKILADSNRHKAAIAGSSVILYSGLHAVLKKPGLIRRIFGLPLIGAGLVALYKTEQATGQSTVQVITESVYNPKNSTKLNGFLDHGYTLAIEQLDIAVKLTEVETKEQPAQKF